MSDKIITADLMARLQRHYIKPGEIMTGGMFLPEVTLGVRRADALYVGFFASRGKWLVGHEVKASRADWLHELDQPAKAETWVPQCHAWYVVAPSTDIVRPAELPEGWGLMVPNARTTTRLDTVVKAAHHPEREPSWEATHALVQKADSMRMAGIHAVEDRLRTAHQVEVDKRVEERLAHDRGALPAQRNRADSAEALLREVYAAIGLNVVPDDQQYVSDRVVRLGELRDEVAAFLAGRVRQRQVLSQRLQNVVGAHQAVRHAEKELGQVEATLQAALEGLGSES